MDSRKQQFATRLINYDVMSKLLCCFHIINTIVNVPHADSIIEAYSRLCFTDGIYFIKLREEMETLMQVCSSSVTLFTLLSSARRWKPLDYVTMRTEGKFNLLY